MGIFHKYTWILLTLSIASHEVGRAVSQDVTGVPDDGRVEVTEELIVAEHVVPLGDQGVPANEQITPSGDKRWVCRRRTLPVDTETVLETQTERNPFPQLVPDDPVPRATEGPPVAAETMAAVVEADHVTEAAVVEATNARADIVIVPDVTEARQVPEQVTTVQAAEIAEVIFTESPNTTGAEPDVPTTQAVEEKVPTTIKDANTTVQPDPTTQPPPVYTTEAVAASTHHDINTTQSESVTTESESETTQGERQTTQSESETTQQERQTTQSEIETTQRESETTTLDVTTQQEEVTTTQKQIITTYIPAKSDDPCDNYILLDDRWRHVSKGGGNHYDSELAGDWLAFQYEGKWAVIPNVPIRVNRCGSKYPYRLELDGKVLPEFNHTIESVLCTAADIGGYYEQCVTRSSVTIKCCDGYYIYKFTELRNKEGTLCMQQADEEVPYRALVDRPATPVPAEVVQTTEEPLPIKSMAGSDISEKQSTGLVTLELSYLHSILDREWFISFEKHFRERLIETLNALAALTTAVPTALLEDIVTQKAIETTKADLMVTQAAAVVTQQDAIVTQQEDNVTQQEPVVTQGDSVVTQAPENPENSIAEQEGEGTVVTNEALADDDSAEEVSATDNSSRPVNPADAQEPTEGIYRRRRDVRHDVMRRDAEEKPELTPDDVTHVEPTPRVQDGTLQMSFFVQDKDDNVIPAEDVLRALKAIQDSDEPLADGDEVKITDMYSGLAAESRRASRESRETIWEAHRGLWITMLVMVGLCIIVLLLCLICMLCCRKHEYQPNEKSPLRQAEEGSRHVAENPIHDDVIMREEAPMVESQNPAFTSNGGGQHLSKDEDNGYIVPLHELSEEERRTVVENTKL